MTDSDGSMYIYIYICMTMAIKLEAYLSVRESPCVYTRSNLTEIRRIHKSNPKP